jgi:hypothetical protein
METTAIVYFPEEDGVNYYVHIINADGSKTEEHNVTAVELYHMYIGAGLELPEELYDVENQVLGEAESIKSQPCSPSTPPASQDY